MWDSESEKIWHQWNDYSNQRSDWVKEAAHDEDFFMGRQWTSPELRQLKERGMAPIVVNRTHPVIMQEVAIVTARRPTFRYMGRDDSDVPIASMWSDVAAFVWDKSSGDIEWKTAVQDSFVTGAGYVQVYIDPYADDGRGEVRFQSLPPWDVYPDPNSRKIDLSDARSIMVSRVIDTDQLEFMYPDMVSKIGRATPEQGSTADRPSVNPRTPEQGQSISVSDYDFFGTLKQKSKVRVIECYEKIKVPYAKMINAAEGREIIVPHGMFDKASAPENVNVITIWREQIRLTVTAGHNVVLYKGMLPTASYPIIPLFLHHARNPYPRGDVSIVKGMQQEINKRRSIMIHNATLSGNYRILAEEGQITNEEDFRLRGTQPGFILKYRNTGSGSQPRELLPQSLPAAWIQLEAEGKQDLEYSVGVFANMMGSAVDAPDTYRALLALEETGQRKISHKTMHASNALKILGRVIFDFARYTYTMPKLVRITGEDNEDYRELWLNEPQVDPVTGELKMVNDTQVGDYDLVVSDGTSMPTNRMAMLSMYLEMFQLGIVDKEEVLKKTDILNKKVVLSRMGEIAQLSGQVQQLAETIKNEQGLNQTLRRGLQQSEVNQGVQAAELQIKGQLMQTQMSQELSRKRIGDELSLLKEKGKLAVREAAVDVNMLLSQAKLRSVLIEQRAKIDAAAKVAAASTPEAK